MSGQQSSVTTACGCCVSLGELTPADRNNPPGQLALNYRVGSHGRFLASQLVALGRSPLLQNLTTRDADDPALALLDSWSAVLDVLSFYQERIINEGFLRTARERRSLLELGRAIGYELRPGVAASTFLAFTLETAPGAPLQTRIDSGLKTQSVPEQDEKPQVFETLEAIEARAVWNELRVQFEEGALPYWGGRTLYLRGQNTGLKPGDALLIVGNERLANPGSENWDFRTVARLLVVPPVEPSGDPLAGYTVVTLDHGLGAVVPHVEPAKQQPRCFALRSKVALFGHMAPDWRAMPRSLRASYLGFDDDNDAPISTYRQWPGYTLADLSDPPTSRADGSGLFAEYFEGTNFRQRIFSRTDATINFHWGAGAPAGLTTDTFSIRWRGWLQIPTDGSYTFYLTGDDGVRLWLDGQLLINEWQDQGATTFSVTVPRLNGGDKLDLRVEFYENSGSATVVLEWSGPGIARQVVPMNRLYPRDIHNIHLDASYPRIVAGSWLVMAIPEYQELYQVLDHREDARAAFTLSGKTSRLTLRGEQLRELFNERLRDTSIYAESVELSWASRPLSGLVGGQFLDLVGLQPDLAEGRWLAITGQGLAEISANAKPRQRLLAGDPLAAVELAKDGLTARLSFTDGEQFTVLLQPLAEVAQLRLNQTLAGHSRLHLEQPLTNRYLPSTVRINANVVSASHGDSKQMQIQPEILGSGDGSRGFQRFELRQKPLTYISAATPAGIASSLEVRVDGLRWHQVERLTAMSANERGYLVRQQDDARVTVQFGDGQFGARLTSGQMNVTARYRVGIGAEGNVKAGQISLLLNRPLGVKGVINPLAASGGTDPEDGERARRNAPLTVRALERIVSLRDFEDFAAAFAGIGKAQAVWLWDGEGRLVHLTVVAANGEAIDPSGALYRNLAAAIDSVRPAYQPLRLAPGRLLRFGVSARLLIDPDYPSPQVLTAVRSALADAFGFEQRDYGQSLSGSEVVAVIQGVAGVVRVDLDLLRLTDGNQVTVVNGPDGRLQARRARWQGNQILPAQLLLLNDDDLILTELSA